MGEAKRRKADGTYGVLIMDGDDKEYYESPHSQQLYKVKGLVPGDDSGNIGILAGQLHGQWKFTTRLTGVVLYRGMNDEPSFSANTAYGLSYIMTRGVFIDANEVKEMMAVCLTPDGGELQFFFTEHKKKRITGDRLKLIIMEAVRHLPNDIRDYVLKGCKFNIIPVPDKLGLL